MTPQHLTLSSEPLEEFKDGLNAILSTLINSLIERDLETGEVTAKIKVTVKTTQQQDGTMLHMLKFDPELKMKIGAKGQVKCKSQNGILMKYDRDGNIIIGERQMEIDDYIRG